MWLWNSRVAAIERVVRDAFDKGELREHVYEYVPCAGFAEPGPALREVEYLWRLS